MAKFTNPLDNISVASPCAQDWDQMIGGERKRYCGDCKLNVYNLSGMTRAEAENLLLNSEDRLCVRFYRRADGSVLTKDCPVGWQAIKRRVSKTAAAAFSLFAGLLGGLGFMNAFGGKNETTIGTTVPVLTTPTPHVIMGDIAEESANEMTMGAVAVSTPTPRGNMTMGNVSMPTPTTKKENYEVGKVLIKKN